MRPGPDALGPWRLPPRHCCSWLPAARSRRGRARPQSSCPPRCRTCFRRPGDRVAQRRAVVGRSPWRLRRAAAKKSGWRNRARDRSCIRKEKRGRKGRTRDRFRQRKHRPPGLLHSRRDSPPRPPRAGKAPQSSHPPARSRAKPVPSRHRRKSPLPRLILQDPVASRARHRMWQQARRRLRPVRRD